MPTLVPIVLTVFLVVFLSLFAGAVAVFYTVLRRLIGNSADPTHGGSTPRNEGQHRQRRDAITASSVASSPLTIPGWYWPGRGGEMVE
jgi:hypothetical protein